MNVWDILILLAVAVIAGFSCSRVRKRKAEGKSTCCGTCESCSLCGTACSVRHNGPSE